ncbi:hypothetical protein [Streptomyces liangshanensis]|uniref:hypothetical protein n=1 Tax=Streptomyces liangshanensis TaxID=2717324 RepID=UPI0036D86170
MVRVGSCGDWSFAVEYGMGDGRDNPAEISRDGVEVIVLEPSPDHPPRTFSYSRDGVVVCGFGLGDELRRWGEHPYLLLPDLTAGATLYPDGRYARPDTEHYRARDRHTLSLIESHFTLSLPREEANNERLPAFVVALSTEW